MEVILEDISYQMKKFANANLINTMLLTNVTIVTCTLLVIKIQITKMHVYVNTAARSLYPNRRINVRARHAAGLTVQTLRKLTGNVLNVQPNLSRLAAVTVAIVVRAMVNSIP